MRILFSFLFFSVFTTQAQIQFNEVIQAVYMQLGYSCSAWGDYDNDSDPDFVVMGQTDLGARHCILYRNNGDSTFTNMLVGLPNIAFGALAWSDYDKDGDLDLALQGMDESGIRQTKIFNNSGGLFANSGISIAPSSHGNITWHDYNYDGHTDLLICGSDNNGLPITKLYKNNNGSFYEEENFALASLKSSCAVWADLNNDGRKDLIIQGEDGSNNKHCRFYKSLRSGSLVEQIVTGISTLTNGQITIADVDNDGKLDFAISGQNQLSSKVCEVYRNEGDFLFSRIATLTGLDQSSIEFGDIDNDGDPDLITGGETASGNRTYIYYNNGNLTFNQQTGFVGTYAGVLRWSDFDSDLDLDFIQSGIEAGNAYTKLSRNLSSSPNTAPSVPTMLSEVIYEDSVTLSWSAPTDANGGALSYNIFIGTSKITQNIVESNSNIANGYHRIISNGNADLNTFIKIYNLEQGKYYWSVQAIDNSYSSSPFAVVDSFVVCKRFSIGNDTVLCYGDEIHLTAGIGGDVVNWYSSSTPLIASNTYSINHAIITDDTIWAQRSNNVNGCVTYDTIKVRVNNRPTIHAGIDSSICLNASLVLGGSPTASNSIFVNTYKWYPSYGLNDSTLANPTATPLIDTVYRVIVRSGVCNADTAEVRITIDPLPEVNASADTVIGFGQDALLVSSGANTYSWTPSISLTGPLTATPKAHPTETTLYIVTGTDISGCIDTADVKVSVENRFFIPELFSPNDDGNNDVFLIYGVGINQLSFKIFNQSGLEVYSSSNVEELTTIGWDGTSNGVALNGQALLWIADGKFADGSEITFNGKKNGSLILKR